VREVPKSVHGQLKLQQGAQSTSANSSSAACGNIASAPRALSFDMTCLPAAAAKTEAKSKSQRGLGCFSTLHLISLVSLNKIIQKMEKLRKTTCDVLGNND